MVSDDGRHRVTLELAILCVDSRGLLVGEHRQPLVVTISKADYEKALASGRNSSGPLILEHDLVLVLFVAISYALVDGARAQEAVATRRATARHA
jgi:hypothetical protein